MCKEDIWEIDVSPSTMLLHCLGKHISEGSVKMFYQPISCSDLINAHDLVHSLHQFGQESCTSEFARETIHVW